MDICISFATYSYLDGVVNRPLRCKNEVAAAASTAQFPACNRVTILIEHTNNVVVDHVGEHRCLGFKTASHRVAKCRRITGKNSLPAVVGRPTQPLDAFFR